MEPETVKIEPKDFRVEHLESVWDLTSSQQWLVDNLIPEGGLIMVTGESGCGKSTFTLLLADAVSKGEPFLGLQTTQRDVLIVDKENGLTIYHERFKRFELPKNDHIRVWGNFSPIEPPTPDSIAIRKYAQEVKPLIIYDSFVAFHPGDEQDATSTRKYMDQYRMLVASGATVVLIHHTGKGENTKEYRGSSDIKASLDVGYKLIAKKTELQSLQLKPFKVREGLIRPLMLTLEENKLVVLDGEFIQETDKDWAPVEQVVKEFPGANQQFIIKKLEQMSVPRVRKILMAGKIKGIFRVESGANNSSLYYPSEPKAAR